MQQKEAVFCGAAEAMNAIVAKMGCPSVNVKEVEKVSQSTDEEINELKGKIATLTAALESASKVSPSSDTTELKTTKAELEAAKAELNKAEFELISAEHANDTLTALVQKANQAAEDARRELKAVSITTAAPSSNTGIKIKSPIEKVTKTDLDIAIDKLKGTSFEILPAHIKQGKLDPYIYYEQYGIKIPTGVITLMKDQINDKDISKKYNESYRVDKQNNLDRIRNLLLVLNNTFVENKDNDVLKELLRFTLDKFIPTRGKMYSEAFPITIADIFEPGKYEIMNNLGNPQKFKIKDFKLVPVDSEQISNTPSAGTGLADPNILSRVLRRKGGGRQSRKAMHHSRHPRKTRKQPTK